MGSNRAVLGVLVILSAIIASVAEEPVTITINITGYGDLSQAQILAILTEQFSGENASFVINDADECSNETLNDCTGNTDCVNTAGSYQCNCKSGYTGTGDNCSAIITDTTTESTLLESETTVEMMETTTTTTQLDETTPTSDVAASTNAVVDTTASVSDTSSPSVDEITTISPIEDLSTAGNSSESGTVVSSIASETSSYIVEETSFTTENVDTVTTVGPMAESSSVSPTSAPDIPIDDTSTPFTASIADNSVSATTTVQTNDETSIPLSEIPSTDEAAPFVVDHSVSVTLESTSSESTFNNESSGTEPFSPAPVENELTSNKVETEVVTENNPQTSEESYLVTTGISEESNFLTNVYVSTTEEGNTETEGTYAAAGAGDSEETTATYTKEATSNLLGDISSTSIDTIQSTSQTSGSEVSTEDSPSSSSSETQSLAVEISTSSPSSSEIETMTMVATEGGISPFILAVDGNTTASSAAEDSATDTTTLVIALTTNASTHSATEAATTIPLESNNPTTSVVVNNSTDPSAFLADLTTALDTTEIASVIMTESTLSGDVESTPTLVTDVNPTMLPVSETTAGFTTKSTDIVNAGTSETFASTLPSGDTSVMATTVTNTDNTVTAAVSSTAVPGDSTIMEEFSTFVMTAGDTTLATTNGVTVESIGTTMTGQAAITTASDNNTETTSTLQNPITSNQTETVDKFVAGTGVADGEETTLTNSLTTQVTSLSLPAVSTETAVSESSEMMATTTMAAPAFTDLWEVNSASASDEGSHTATGMSGASHENTAITTATVNSDAGTTIVEIASVGPTPVDESTLLTTTNISQTTSTSSSSTLITGSTEKALSTIVATEEIFGSTAAAATVANVNNVNNTFTSYATTGEISTVTPGVAVFAVETSVAYPNVENQTEVDITEGNFTLVSEGINSTSSTPIAAEVTSVGGAASTGSTDGIFTTEPHSTLSFNNTSTFTPASALHNETDSSKPTETVVVVNTYDATEKTNTTGDVASDVATTSTIHALDAEADSMSMTSESHSLSQSTTETIGKVSSVEDTTKNTPTLSGSVDGLSTEHMTLANDFAIVSNVTNAQTPYTVTAKSFTANVTSVVKDPDSTVSYGEVVNETETSLNDGNTTPTSSHVTEITILSDVVTATEKEQLYSPVTSHDNTYSQATHGSVGPVTELTDTSAIYETTSTPVTVGENVANVTKASTYLGGVNASDTIGGGDEISTQFENLTTQATSSPPVNTDVVTSVVNSSIKVPDVQTTTPHDVTETAPSNITHEYLNHTTTTITEIPKTMKTSAPTSQSINSHASPSASLLTTLMSLSATQTTKNGAQTASSDITSNQTSIHTTGPFQNGTSPPATPAGATDASTLHPGYIVTIVLATVLVVVLGVMAYRHYIQTRGLRSGVYTVNPPINVFDPVVEPQNGANSFLR